MILVAPLAGAWIEIGKSVYDKALISVAPLAGAWIEIADVDVFSNLVLVAPLAGAWIEIEMLWEKYGGKYSRSPCGSVD